MKIDKGNIQNVENVKQDLHTPKNKKENNNNNNPGKLKYNQKRKIEKSRNGFYLIKTSSCRVFFYSLFIETKFTYDFCFLFSSWPDVILLVVVRFLYLCVSTPHIIQSHSKYHIHYVYIFFFSMPFLNSKPKIFLFRMKLQLSIYIEKFAFPQKKKNRRSIKHNNYKTFPFLSSMSSIS